jgi:hypothetical protein
VNKISNLPPLKQERSESREQRAESREQKAESREQRAESRKQRASIYVRDLLHGCEGHLELATIEASEIVNLGGGW